MKYYKLLGVAQTASDDEIKKAYRKLAMQFHPDRNPGNKQAEEKFKEISEAYAVLSEPDKRKQYDSYGDAAFAGNAGQGFREDAFRHADFSSIFQEMGFGGFDFDSFFGGAAGQQGRRRGGASSAGGARGRNSGFQQSNYSDESYDVEHELEIGFMESYSGGERSINLNLTNGENINVRARIPAGIEAGKKLRLKNQGAKKPNGTRGDLYLKVKVGSHPNYTREHENLESKVYLPFSLFCLGGTAEVETPEGIKRVKIKEGLECGTKLRLKGLGFPQLGSQDPKARGDLYVTLLVKIPVFEQLSAEQKQSLEQLGV
jgi:DnaJ-class molecular chaperone